MANRHRGEVPVTVAGHDLVLVGEFGRLAEVSSALGGCGFGELMARINQNDPAAVLACLLHLDTTDEARNLIEKPAIDVLQNTALTAKIAIAIAGGEKEEKKPKAAESR